MRKMGREFRIQCDLNLRKGSDLEEVMAALPETAVSEAVPEKAK